MAEDAFDGRTGRVQRLTEILEQLANAGALRITDTAPRLGVSAATLRRDLAHLERRHLLTRTHGGAVGRTGVYELSLGQRASTLQAEKVRIGAVAAGLVGEHANVGLTGGTTASEVGRALADRSDLTVVTNALNVAWDLIVHPGIKLVLTGGVCRAMSYELTGPLANAALDGMNLDVAFVGADGIDVGGGITTHNELEAHTNRQMLERARLVVVVADHTKLGRLAFVRIAPIASIHQLITDAAADPALVASLRGAGVQVTLA